MWWLTTKPNGSTTSPPAPRRPTCTDDLTAPTCWRMFPAVKKRSYAGYAPHRYRRERRPCRSAARTLAEGISKPSRQTRCRAPRQRHPRRQPCRVHPEAGNADINTHQRRIRSVEASGEASISCLHTRGVDPTPRSWHELLQPRQLKWLSKRLWVRRSQVELIGNSNPLRPAIQLFRSVS